MEHPIRPLRVAHVVETLGGSEHLWGKERVIAQVMREQRASGEIQPLLIALSASRLERMLTGEGFRAMSLTDGPVRLDGVARRLARVLRREQVDVVHTHGYKANLLARALRVLGRLPHLRIVSTCHGWVTHDRKLTLYNALDRWTAMISDVTTVPDSEMLRAFPVRHGVLHVPNGVPDTKEGGVLTLRATPHELLAGTLGRIERAKGIDDIMAAAKAVPTVSFVIAGSGPMIADVREQGGNLRYIGFVDEADPYLRALDIYVQASHAEGLSLSLLEAMRNARAIVATRVGATEYALEHGVEALLVPPHAPDLLAAAIARLAHEPLLRARLGAAARRRYLRDFHVRSQHRRFLQLYARGYAR